METKLHNENENEKNTESQNGNGNAFLIPPLLTRILEIQQGLPGSGGMDTMETPGGLDT